LYASAGGDDIGSYIVKDVYIHKLANINNWDGMTEEAHRCMVVLLQQYGLYWLTFLI
jgi:hypothetical protein